MESNLRHGYQASLLGLFFHVTLTPNTYYLHIRVIYRHTPVYLEHPVYPCTCIDLPDITRFVLKTFISGA